MTVPQDGITDLLDDLLSETVITFHPTMARVLGGIPEAVFLHHLMFWTKRSNDGWAYRTQEEIAESTTISIDAQQRVREVLKGLGILVEERRRGNRLFYRVERSRLFGLLVGGEASDGGARKGPLEVPPSPPLPLTPPLIPPKEPNDAKVSTPPKGSPKGKSSTGQTTIPPDFGLLERTRQLVVAYPLITETDIDLELPRFVAHHEAKGTKHVDWQAAFRKWMLNVSTWRREKSGYKPVVNIEQSADSFVTRTARMSEERRRYLERRAARGDEDAARELRSS